MFPPLRTPNLAFRNRGDLTFEEVGSRWGFDALDVSHSIALGDLDNDGDLDAVVNGFLHNVDDLDTREQIKRMGNLNIGQSRRTFLMFEKLETPNLAFHNRRDPTFLETGREWGFDSPQISNGMAMGDLDGDARNTKPRGSPLVWRQDDDHRGAGRRAPDYFGGISTQR